MVIINVENSITENTEEYNVVQLKNGVILYTAQTVLFSSKGIDVRGAS